jgi:hypothetical protein
MRFFAVRRFKEVNAMMRWQVRFGRALLGLGAVLALVVGSGAGTRW